MPLAMTSKTRIRAALVAIAVAFTTHFAAMTPSTAIAKEAAETSDAATVRAIESLVEGKLKAEEPGAAILVARNGKVIFRRAYGMANVETKTPLKPDDVFRIGSVTKQFTAVAILMLADEGKLSVSDEITKYLPDFPTRGKRITIEHLLTHTSGIRGYTEMPDFQKTINERVSVNAMIDRFKNEQLQFDPGTRWSYSNSGYFLLGAIVEKVSGMDYAAFMAKRIFIPLEMKDTAYEGVERSGKKRVEGYTKAERFAVDGPIDMSQPYAAGALVSTVDDLLVWNNAITAGKLLKPQTWKAAFTPFTLADGSKTTYGYGWQINKFQGKNTIEHGGGINGFASNGVRFPDEGVFVAVLKNAIGNANMTAATEQKIISIAIGKPLPEYKAISLDNAALDKHIGTYKVDEKITRTIVREGNQLFSQRTGAPRFPITPASATTFFAPDGLATLAFETDAAGETTHVVVTDARSTNRNQRISKTPPAGRIAILLSAIVLDQYIGNYELAPNFVLAVSRNGEKFVIQATGQGPLEFFAESENKFFARDVDAQVKFNKDASGKVNELILYQGGRETPGKRTK
jgi:D-alanyl-D-alanine carboxypeptidase